MLTAKMWSCMLVMITFIFVHYAICYISEAYRHYMEFRIYVPGIVPVSMPFRYTRNGSKPPKKLQKFIFLASQKPPKILLQAVVRPTCSAR